MARPERNDIDYFPHEVTHGKKMFIIENKYKNDGYSVWFKILEELGKANYHYLDFNDTEQLMYLSSKFNVTEDLLLNIVEDLAKLNAINKDLYLDNKIVFSEKFIESVQDAYKRRNNKCISLEGLCKHLNIKCNPKPLSKGLNVGSNPQSKVEYTKPKEIIVNNIKKDILNSSIWIEQISMQKRENIKRIETLLNTFLNDLELQGEIDKGEKEIKKHFINWLNIELKKPKETKKDSFSFSKS